MLLILLVIPISLSLSLTIKQQVEGYASIVGLFGLLKFQTHFPGEPKSTQRPESHTKIFKNKNANVRIKNSRQRLSFFSRPAFRRHIIKFIKRLLIATHAKNLYLKCHIGLSDPADTGRLWALIGPLSGLLKNLQIITIQIEPEFINEGIEIESHGNFQLIPLQFITLIIAFMFSPTTIHAWKILRLDNK